MMSVRIMLGFSLCAPRFDQRRNGRWLLTAHAVAGHQGGRPRVHMPITKAAGIDTFTSRDCARGATIETGTRRSVVTMGSRIARQ
jgi:hypothetical protein